MPRRAGPPLPEPLAAGGLAAGFVRLIGLEFDEVGPARVTGHLEVGEEHLQPYGLVHGGVYASMAESLASVGAAMAAREAGLGGAVGLENHTSFLRRARGGERIEAEAVPRHTGRRVHSWVVSIRAASDGRELAVSTVRLLTVEPEGV
jgi:1,4-dihydroxy-2-naphthoyl-CoA hydrolase